MTSSTYDLRDLKGVQDSFENDKLSKWTSGGYTKTAIRINGVLDTYLARKIRRAKKIPITSQVIDLISSFGYPNLLEYNTDFGLATHIRLRNEYFECNNGRAVLSDEMWDELQNLAMITFVRRGWTRHKSVIRKDKTADKPTYKFEGVAKTFTQKQVNAVLDKIGKLRKSKRGEILDGILKTLRQKRSRSWARKIIKGLQKEKLITKTWKRSYNQRKIDKAIPLQTVQHYELIEVLEEEFEVYARGVYDPPRTRQIDILADKRIIIGARVPYKHITKRKEFWKKLYDEIVKEVEDEFTKALYKYWLDDPEFLGGSLTGPKWTWKAHGLPELPEGLR